MHHQTSSAMEPARQEEKEPFTQHLEEGYQEEDERDGDDELEGSRTIGKEEKTFGIFC